MMFTFLLQRNLLEVFCTHILHKVSSKASPYTWHCIADGSLLWWVRNTMSGVGQNGGTGWQGPSLPGCCCFSALRHLHAIGDKQRFTQSELPQGCETPSHGLQGVIWNIVLTACRVWGRNSVCACEIHFLKFIFWNLYFEMHLCFWF